LLKSLPVSKKKYFLAKIFRRFPKVHVNTQRFLKKYKISKELENLTGAVLGESKHIFKSARALFNFSTIKK